MLCAKFKSGFSKITTPFYLQTKPIPARRQLGLDRGLTRFKKGFATLGYSNGTVHCTMWIVSQRPVTNCSNQAHIILQKQKVWTMHTIFKIAQSQIFSWAAQLNICDCAIKAFSVGHKFCPTGDALMFIILSAPGIFCRSLFADHWVDHVLYWTSAYCKWPPTDRSRANAAMILDITSLLFTQHSNPRGVLTSPRFWYADENEPSKWSVVQSIKCLWN